MSGTEYHKIDTIFKRDERGRITPEYARPEFEYLKDNEWLFTEKVDGTNVRVQYLTNMPDRPPSFHGKTDNAQMPPHLLRALEVMFTADRMNVAFPPVESGSSVVLYGEGYGPKIQKGGGNYRQDASFVLFDARVNDWWLKREAVEEIGAVLNIEVVPVVGRGTLGDAVAYVERGFESRWGSFQAEGLVIRPRVDLVARNGDRVITKLKTRDFR